MVSVQGVWQVPAMSATYLSLHFHVVFGTKRRERVISTEWISRLHDYLGGSIRNLGAFPEGIGGVADHVHLLVGLKATSCIADVVREVKKASNAWIREEFAMPAFAWQDGYAAFTVSATSLSSVRQYIANQHEHHRVKTFREELVEMLDKAGIDYDPKYLD